MVLSMGDALTHIGRMDAIRVFLDNFEPKHTVSKEEAVSLVLSQCVEPRGTPSKLKYLRLLCSWEEAECIALKEVERIARSVNSGSNKLALDVLQRMSADRKFIYREKLPGLDGKWSGHWTFTHKQPVAGVGVRWESSKGEK